MKLPIDINCADDGTGNSSGAKKELERIDIDNWTAKEVVRLLTLVENDKRYFQEILNIIPIPVSIVTRDLSFAMVNRAFRHLFLLKHEELTDKRLDDMLPHTLVYDRVGRVLDQAAPEAGIRMVFHGFDGTARHGRLSVFPIWDSYSPVPVEALVVLEEPDQTIPPSSKLLEELGAVVWKQDLRTGEMHFATKSATRNWKEGITGDWTKRVISEDASRVAWVYEAASDSGTPSTVEYRALRKDDSIVWLADHIQPVSEDGRVVELRVITLEQSSRRPQLERLVQTREMESSMRLAQQVAHEFNNLWMIVNGYAEVLQERIGQSDEESRSGLEAIQKAAERGIHTTTQLLQFGRPPSTQTKIVDLNELVRHWTLDAALELSSGTAPVSTDSQKLHQSVESLANFAIARLPQGDRLRLKTFTSAWTSDLADGLPRGKFVALALGPVHNVTDRMLSHWCEPYFSESEKPASIGLAPIYSQLKQMGASAQLTRTGDDTAEFQIYMPMARLPEPEKPKAMEPFRRPEAAGPIPKLETVLVVDDEESIRSLVSRVLTRTGYQVLTASSAQDALQQADSFPHAIPMLVADVMLPGMQGPKLAEQLRATRPKMRVVYISGYTDDPAISQGILPPGEGFLQKPFSLQALAQTVRTVLDTPVA